ncbi:MAG: IS1 family transposase [Leptolyngbyaceae bacterium]|nr:IS1 family transposase [Leptolyngbyaceae bacterium]
METTLMAVVASTPVCPKCGSRYVVKNGRIHNGKQNFKCRACNRQFIQNPSNHFVHQETRELIDKMLLERLSLAAIARVVGVPRRWLRTYAKTKRGCAS